MDTWHKSKVLRNIQFDCQLSFEYQWCEQTLLHEHENFKRSSQTKAKSDFVWQMHQLATKTEQAKESN